MTNSEILDRINELYKTFLSMAEDQESIFNDVEYGSWLAGHNEGSASAYRICAKQLQSILSSDREDR